MAIGDSSYSNNNDNTQRKLYDQTYYSRIRFKNDDKSLSFTYRSGLLVIEISSVDKTTYKVTPLSAIHLSPTKAMMMCEEIKAFKKYLEGNKIKENVAFGINGGMGEKISYMGLHTNEKKEIFLTIGKFDANGKIVESNTFQFPKDYNYSLEWKDITKMDVEKVFNNYIELEIFHNTIADFARFMSGAAGYAAADLTRYDHARIMSKMDPIYDKLGIERRSSNYNGGSTNNFLNNAASSSSRSTTIDDLEDIL